jgi:hypothetical protein
LFENPSVQPPGPQCSPSAQGRCSSSCHICFIPELIAVPPVMCRQGTLPPIPLPFPAALLVPGAHAAGGPLAPVRRGPRLRLRIPPCASPQPPGPGPVGRPGALHCPGTRAEEGNRFGVWAPSGRRAHGLGGKEGMEADGVRTEPRVGVCMGHAGKEKPVGPRCNAGPTSTRTFDSSWRPCRVQPFRRHRAPGAADPPLPASEMPSWRLGPRPS